MATGSKMRPKPLALHFGLNLLYFLLNISSIDANYKEELLASDRHYQTDHNDARLGGKSLFDSYSSSHDESKLRLALLVDEKIDRNHDNLVQLDELVNWIHESQNKYITEEANNHWIILKKQLGNSLTWDEYSNKEYEHLLSLSKQAEDPTQSARIRESYESAIRRDLRRWKAADLNQDEKLSLEEFKSFLHPTNHDLLVEEKLEQLDENKDGKISFEEYIADQESSKEKNRWLNEVSSKFSKHLDSNQDNYLDKSELSRTVSKSELYEHSVAEAKQLMQIADLDKNHRLSKEEILQAYHEFVNSHATDFGEALRDQKKTFHDEL